jgi:hypothetical protein
MSFTCSKIDLKLLFEIYLKTKIEKMFSLLTGPSPPFRPISAAGPTFLPRARAPPSGPTWPPRPRPMPAPRLPLLRADAPVPSTLRRSAPHGGHMPSTPAGWHPVAPLARARPSSSQPQRPLPSIRSLSLSLPFRRKTRATPSTRHREP